MMENIKTISDEDLEQLEEMLKKSSRESYDIYKEEREAAERR